MDAPAIGTLDGDPGVFRSQPRMPRTARASPLRLLLADDNAINQKVGAALLTSLGHGVDVVANGVEVLRALESSTYDVDPARRADAGHGRLRNRAPHQNGLGVARTDRPRIVAMTANVRPLDRERCLESGMDDFLAKPLELDTLRTLLDDCPRRS